METERWEVSHDGETWTLYIGREGRPSDEAIRAQGYRYIRRAEPGQPVSPLVTEEHKKAASEGTMSNQLRAPGIYPGSLRAQEKAPEQPEHILQFFAYEHLPEKLALVSVPFAALARQIVDTLPRNPERTVALRKLLEAKDAAVRAAIAK